MSYRNKKVSLYHIAKTKESDCFGFLSLLSNKKDVLVEFKTGEIYIYYEAGKLYEHWVRASSKGKFFHRYIKDKYKYSILKKHGR